MQLELQSIPTSGTDASREVDDLCSALDGNLSLVETCPMCVLCVQKSKSAMSAWGRIGTTCTFPGCGLMTQRARASSSHPQVSDLDVESMLYL